MSHLISLDDAGVRWHGDKVTTLSLPLSASVFGLDREQKQVWERACESGTGGVLANPSPLIAADASMLALSALPFITVGVWQEAFMFVLADDLLLIVSLSKGILLHP